MMISLITFKHTRTHIVHTACGSMTCFMVSHWLPILLFNLLSLFQCSVCILFFIVESLRLLLLLFLLYLPRWIQERRRTSHVTVTHARSLMMNSAGVVLCCYISSKYFLRTFPRFLDQNCCIWWFILIVCVGIPCGASVNHRPIHSLLTPSDIWDDYRPTSSSDPSLLLLPASSQRIAPM